MCLCFVTLRVRWLHPVSLVYPQPAGFFLENCATESHVLLKNLGKDRCTILVPLIIEDVERGAELSFKGPGPLRGPLTWSAKRTPPLHHRQILVSNDQILVSDRQTDGRTDRRNKHILGLPS